MPLYRNNDEDPGTARIGEMAHEEIEGLQEELAALQAVFQEATNPPSRCNCKIRNTVHNTQAAVLLLKLL